MWSSTKKFSWPTISIRLLAFITSRDTRGKPSGSNLLADKNEETGVMLRVGELDVDDDDKYLSFCGDMNMGGMDDADEPRGGVHGTAVVGREMFCEAALSRSSTFSAMATMRLAIFSNTSVILTIALVALRQSRPAMAMSA